MVAGPGESNMSLTPLMVHVQGRCCVVVGGGRVAERKINTLLKAQADVCVISPQLTASLNEQREQFTWCNRPYHSNEIEKAFIVIAATDCKQTNRQIYEECKEHIPLINVVDHPELCTLTFPGVVSRGPLQIAISTSGASPAMTRNIRQKLEKQFGPEYEPFLERLSELRGELLQQMTPDQRKLVFQHLVDSNLLDVYRQYDNINKDIQEQEIDQFITRIMGDIKEGKV